MLNSCRVGGKRLSVLGAREDVGQASRVQGRGFYCLAHHCIFPFQTHIHTQPAAHTASQVHFCCGTAVIQKHNKRGELGQSHHRSIAEMHHKWNKRSGWPWPMCHKRIPGEPNQRGWGAVYLKDTGI